VSRLVLGKGTAGSPSTGLSTWRRHFGKIKTNLSPPRAPATGSWTSAAASHHPSVAGCAAARAGHLHKAIPLVGGEGGIWGEGGPPWPSLPYLMGEIEGRIKVNFLDQWESALERWGSMACHLCRIRKNTRRRTIDTECQNQTHGERFSVFLFSSFSFSFFCIT
jgi:hypothetical protein